MKSFFARKSQKPILERCRKDQSSLMRQKYAPWYHSMDAQRKTRVEMNGRNMVMLTSNDYVGLTFHPKVIEAGKEALDKWGSSTTGARSANGSRRYHIELEEALASFLNKEACQVSSAGYISCATGIASFAQRGDVILADKSLHSSLWDGIRLSHASMERFSHNSAKSLRDELELLDPKVAKLLAIEGVFSMEGHISPLPELLDVSDEFGCFVVMDDAHGIGVLGKDGRGTASHFDVEDGIDILVGSLSKSLSSTGGFVAGDKESIEYLRTHSKQTIFSAALCPSQAACAKMALQIMQEEPEHRERLWANTERYKKLLLDLKLDTWGSETPAIPIVLGSKERAYFFWKNLLEKGVFTVMSIAPGVPPGKDLIRTSISASHTDEDFEIIAEAFAYAVKKL
jgi:7-keto-8-aminopelargonate synthetase-like enzyme